MPEDPTRSTETRAAEQSAANAALEAVDLDDEERELIERRHSGDLTHEQFVAEVIALAKRKGPLREDERAALEAQSFRPVESGSPAATDFMSERLAECAAAMRSLAPSGDEQS